MGKMVYYGYNPTLTEPPAEDPPVMECPICGAELYEGDTIYTMQDGKGHEKTFACEHCIEDYAEVVGE